MLGSLQIEALSHKCAACSKSFTVGHLVLAAYWQKHITEFSRQIELGLIGANIRNTWVHFSCDKPLTTDWAMTPDMHVCIRCKTRLGNQDMVQPVFQIIDANAINPSDPTDIGVALNERIYFVHCDCKNTALNKSNTNILVGL